MQIAKQRLYLNAGKTALVAAGHRDAATLYCAPGDEIPDSAAEKFGLVDGALKGFKGAKEDKGGSDKERRQGEDKGGSQGGKPPETKTLNSLPGIGAATAKNLNAAGIADIAALAAVDPAAPPKVEKLPPAFDWAKVVEAAKAAAPETAPETADA